MLQIGSLALENRLVMAPMAGISNLPFRLIVKKMGAALVFSEMVSAMGLAQGHPKTRTYLESDPEEKPLAVQIFGARPDIMAEAARIAVRAGADMVDINMGCPVKKVLKTGAGGALLRNGEAVRGMVATVRRACTVPLTVKIRTGWSPREADPLGIAQIIQGEGADALTIHPRFVSQGFSGKADWTVIARIKEALTIPVIGNGDVFRPQLALDMIDRTGCDGVMIGRGALAAPWIFRQILELETGLTVRHPALSERRFLILDHYRHLCERVGERRAAYKMRGILLWYTKGLPHSARFRGTVSSIKDFDTMIAAMDSYFDLLEP
ncbi:MAG: tRNA dihydrouridine synthase DusB [Deltaproteobacteria bacterium]|nr:tRNA dihydrouridine synthase DusB [Deltaproteobacteria bacterium]MBW1817793.1 tRNA dihydrouridine synthase DusB [Deltaproteobacteria bacterium]MBW2283021.1 tRNA dihydrouridine synthase DusB [Deltaproteobacteria bacterium]